MSRSCIIFLVLAVVCSFSDAQEERPIHIGILTDCQYCNCPDEGARMYRLSLSKLDSCVETFNAIPLDAVFHLGDMIDHGYGNYDSVIPRFRRFNAPLYLVLGNHDYMIGKEFRVSLMDRLGLKDGYYRVDIGNWSFIVLDGDDLSYFAPQTRAQKEERNEILAVLYSGIRFNGMIWNGGIGREQMKWLKEQLTEAQKGGRNVIVICHFPLFSRKDLNLFNNHELFSALAGSSCVKAYFCGHFHSGNYQEKQGIHLVNFKGMVSTAVNSFSVVTLTADSILIRGYGREPGRRLGIR